MINAKTFLEELVSNRNSPKKFRGKQTTPWEAETT